MSLTLTTLAKRVVQLEESLHTYGVNTMKEFEKPTNERIMSLEQQIKKIEEQLLKESQFRNADYELIEKLEKRLRELELRVPKKRGRKPKVKLADEDFE